MLGGIIPAIALLVLKYFGVISGLDLYYWPFIFLISLVACFIGTYTAPPTNTETLKKFYTTVKPWGFWKPVHTMVIADDPSFKANKRVKLDMFNVVLGIVAQCCLTLLPMYIVLWLQLPLLVTVIILVIIIFILKKTWWNKLED